MGRRAQLYGGVSELSTTGRRCQQLEATVRFWTSRPFVTESVPLHLGMKSRPGEAEQAGCVRLIALGPPQGLGEQRAFDFSQQVLVGAIAAMLV